MSTEVRCNSACRQPIGLQSHNIKNRKGFIIARSITKCIITDHLRFFSLSNFLEPDERF